MGNKGFLFFILFLFSLSLVQVSSQQEENTGGAVAEMYDFHQQFLNLFPRYPGSAAEEAVVDIIIQTLQGRDIRFTKEDFSSFEDGHSFSTNIGTLSFGEGGDTLLVVVPIGHRAGADRDAAAWNLSVGLGLLGYLHDLNDAAALPVQVQFLFAGGEFPFDSNRQFGSELFLENFYPKGDIAVVYLSLSSVPGEVRIKNGTDGLFSPFWIIDSMSQSMERGGMTFNADLEETQLFRLGISGAESRIVPYLAAEFPTVELQSTGYYDKSPETLESADWLDRFLVSFRTFIEDNRDGMPGEWDKHYIYLQFGLVQIFITERTYIFILLGILTLITAFILFYRRRIGKYRKILLRKLWALVVLFLIILIFLIIGTFTIRGISSLRRFSRLWMQSPLMFLLLKVTTAFMFFAVFYRYLKQFPFPKVRSFYSASAIVLFFILIVISAVLDISFVIFFIWPFFWAVLFSLFQNKYSKLYCLILAPGSLAYGIYLLFKHPSPISVDFLINSPLWGNVFIALIILPFTLMVIRTVIAFNDAAVSTLDLHGWVLFSIPLAAFIALTLYAFLFQPFTEAGQQTVVLQERIDSELQERSLFMSSNAPLPAVRFGSGLYTAIEGGRTTAVTELSDEMIELVKIDSEKREFLDRKYYTLTVDARGVPMNVRLRLFAEAELVIYDSNFPFRVAGEGNSGEVYIGSYPPVPLVVELVLPEEQTVDLQCIVEYADPPYDLEIITDADVKQRTFYILWEEL